MSEEEDGGGCEVNFGYLLVDVAMECVPRTPPHRRRPCYPVPAGKKQKEKWKHEILNHIIFVSGSCQSGRILEAFNRYVSDRSIGFCSKT